MGNLITPEDVKRVVALDAEPVLRNLLITQSYHDLSEAMRARTGGSAINWCTLGTWASKTAGRFIREEEVPRPFRELLDRGNIFGRLASELDPVGLLELVEKIISDVSAYILAGNRVVYAELAQAFSDFVTELGDDRAFDQARLDAFLARYRPGPPEPDHAVWDSERKALVSTPQGGQDELRACLAACYQAMFERDSKRRAELLLKANGHGGVHEQTRLQTYIAGSLDAPIADTLLAHVHGHVDNTVDNHTARSIIHRMVDEVVPAIGRRVEEAWESFATAAMMELTLPDGVIHLGNPIPAEPGCPLIPPELATIDDPALRAMLEKYDALEVREEPSLLERIRHRLSSLVGLGHPETPSLLAAAAHDWVNLSQRMRFILVLFRSRADDAHLVAPPFSEAQRDAILGGRVPAGPL
ncbi:MAG TPA: hypothetical protein VM261_02430 [Kofleriaceae bacterium]|nr:hypothetical protein [Kofleriaceae bacterium]